MPQVHFKRGNFIESSHRIEAVVVDRAGRLVLAKDRPHYRTFWRSGAKSFQILPFLAHGGMEKFALTERQLAVMVSSHSGDQFHLQLVQAILSNMGLSPENLACGVSEPLDPAIARQLYKEDRPYTALHNDCSGKHSAMLGLALLTGAPLAGYTAPGHQVQRLMRSAVARAAGLAENDMDEGVDGCGVPTFSLPLYNMALAYARLSDPTDEDWQGRHADAARVRDAMRAHPDCIGGRGRFETVLMEVTGGRLIAKLGAEASLCIGSCPAGQGLVFKIVDGGRRALDHFGIHILRRLDWITAAEQAALLQHFPPEIRNDHHQPVGSVEIEWDC
jgi:L-asparaginase II